MKKTNFLHVLLGITASSVLAFSCISEEVNDVKGNSETISLIAPSEQTVAFKIGYNVPEGYSGSCLSAALWVISPATHRTNAWSSAI